MQGSRELLDMQSWPIRPQSLQHAPAAGQMQWGRGPRHAQFAATQPHGLDSKARPWMRHQGTHPVAHVQRRAVGVQRQAPVELCDARPAGTAAIEDNAERTRQPQPACSAVWTGPQCRQQGRAGRSMLHAASPADTPKLRNKGSGGLVRRMLSLRRLGRLHRADMPAQIQS